MRKHFVTIIILMFLEISHASAVAYCALRDPISAMHQFFPEYTRYTAIDGYVDESVVKTLQGFLPDIYFNEFGTHTLYVIFDGPRTIGYAHARTEKGDWGLDEIVWGLTPDLRLVDFRFQRVRSQGRHIVESKEFFQWISGRSAAEIASLLDDSGKTLTNKPDFITDESEALAVRVLRSAIKTILVIEDVWPGYVKASPLATINGVSICQ